MNIKKAETLLAQVEKRLENMENRCVTFKGHKNVSRSDMEMLKVRLVTALELGYYSPEGWIYDPFISPIMDSL